ncbi:phospholipase A [Vibrio methylphosphonaticus]|uniref:phospholipase A n=1 Tax=Vibrio methylphosphonaticus TaxID=2946866 RepID=UPI00202A0EE1|nr:phospholipase A [Vibrio methylphosphonaticus]MCL9773800.1 phospholipase A [Vibrio methylphosphonaticus]
MKRIFTALVMLSFLNVAYGEETSSCQLNQIDRLNDATTLGEVRRYCNKTDSVSSIATRDKSQSGAISQRLSQEREAERGAFVLTPHRMNYLLPVYTTSSLTPTKNQSSSDVYQGLKTVEAQFQISLKFPLTFDSLFVPGDKIYGAFTLEAWWQVYAKDISSPFRETNYRPEIFYAMPLDWNPLGGNTGMAVGLEHQSNGRAGVQSRSWNRVYLNLAYERDRIVAYIRPWYRLPEDPKTDTNGAQGDDNPDIEDYFGHGEIGVGYDLDKYKVSMFGRGNVKTGKGAVTLNVTTPLYGKLRGYIKVFHGYGDSLIDYNHSQTRLGIGVTLNDLF